MMWIKYAFSFLLLLRFGKKTTTKEFIKRTYGGETLKLFYTYFDICKKFEKYMLDIDFHLTCKTYEIFLKFLKFKLYKKCLHYKEFL